ncbi:TSUP family transporter [Aquibacillus halophilus]|uniref:Probable membrane transporter protein n=1 Tax=Aquibacillus halophilus TaxID=930132 RepID=A0A6A8DLS0_9BACI|nr:sulfite exporter TauE/SafE family protein [Aquibacillus halophilus]MRH44709.1 TSUP family transporter [Aquibacillus halophilus]
MVFFICVIIGFLSAFIGSLVGLGGGVILVPSLLILYELFDSFNWANSHNIVGISLLVMVFTALSSSISYFKEKRIDYKSGGLFVIGSVPGGIFGSWLNQFLHTEIFSLYFGLLMFAIFLMFFFKANILKRKRAVPNKWTVDREVFLNGTKQTYSFSSITAIVIAMAVGTLSGLFGIGGGSLMVPIMVLLFGFPAHIATATSMYMIFFLSLISSLTHIILGHIPWEYVWLFIPGAWIGGTIGAMLNKRLKSSTLEWVLRIILIVIGIRLIWQGIG